jgi:ribose/xylose/arabinose/galactoside ABC-type transport system permease subunit
MPTERLDSTQLIAAVGLELNAIATVVIFGAVMIDGLNQKRRGTR